jgi:hypothetical protein
MNDIEAIKKRKEDLEKLIADMLKQFMVETDVVITGIDYGSVYHSEQGKVVEPQNVSITELSIKLMNPFG